MSRAFRLIFIAALALWGAGAAAQAPENATEVLAEYRTAILDAEAAAKALPSLRDLFATLTRPEQPLADLMAEQLVIDQTISDLLAEIDGLRENDGGDAALTGASKRLETAMAEAEAIDGRVMDAALYVGLSGRIARFEARVAAAPTVAAGLLAQAAGGPVTRDMAVEVNRLLGLSDDPLDGAVLDQLGPAVAAPE